MFDCKDPVKLCKELWPDVTLYGPQKEIMYSVWDNDWTVVPAGHMLGKDFVTALICLVFFLTRHPCRVVTTSVDGPQLEGVLWGEINNFINNCKYKLKHEEGGPLVVTHLNIRKVVGGVVDGLSYLRGRVAAKGEGLSGHHIAQTGDGIPRTLGVSDESSGVDEESVNKMTEWANRLLLIGNPYPCENPFKWAVKGRPGTNDKGGDIKRPGGKGYFRKVIQIKAKDSPNVRYGLAEEAAGNKPSNRILIPGVLPYFEYLHRLKIWDPVKICVGIDAEFWEGAEALLFPPQWLDAAADFAESVKEARSRSSKNAYEQFFVPRKARAVGIDTGEGSSETSLTAVDKEGIIEQVSERTPDTSEVDGFIEWFVRKHRCSWGNVWFDLGGGGKWVSDRLRKAGKPVKTVAFGAPPKMTPRLGMRLLGERMEESEEKYAYMNMRAQMYGVLSLVLDPEGYWAQKVGGFGIPGGYVELRRQLAPLPRLYNEEGRLYLPPKNRREFDVAVKSKKKTLIDILGCSPDRADSLVVAVHGMLSGEGIPETVFG